MVRILKAPIRIAGLYFLLATIAIVFTRFDGGFAFLWFATAYLIGEMAVAPRRRWPRLIAAATAGNVLATGVFGLGWGLALPAAIVNMSEAWIASYLLRTHARRAPFDSLSWLGRFILSVAIVAPACSAMLAGALAVGLGSPPIPAMIHLFTGHALGNLTFAPICILVAQGELRSSLERLSGRLTEAIALMGLSTIVTVACFAQRNWPLLFLPVLPIILIAFRLGRGATALAIIILALAGGADTLLGGGQLHLIAGDAGVRMQCFQFYLAATVLTVWPVASDLRNRTMLHAKLRQSEERYRLIAEYSSDILMKVDREGRIRFVSPSISTIGGYDADKLNGHPAAQLIAPEHRELGLLNHRAALNHPNETRSFEYEGLLADGSRRWFETHLRAVMNADGVAIGTISIIRDISVRKANETSLSAAASTDALTGVLNRRGFLELVAQRSTEGPSCLAVFDIDHFKQVNDRYGHAAGDAVLRCFASIARCALRETDLIGRYGGEEFIVFLPNTSLDQALGICERVRSDVAIARAFAGGVAIGVTVSGGVAQVQSDGLPGALKAADAALYSAKNGGRDQLAAAA